MLLKGFIDKQSSVKFECFPTGHPHNKNKALFLHQNIGKQDLICEILSQHREAFVSSYCNWQ